MEPTNRRKNSVVISAYMSGTTPDFWTKHFFQLPRSLPLSITIEDSPMLLPEIPSGVTTTMLPRLSKERLSKFGVKESGMSNAFAWWAFISSLAAARDLGFSHMLYIEEDCRFVPHWDSIVWGEFIIRWAANNGLMWAGSPVVWHPWSNGYVTSSAVFRFGYSVLKETGLPMACEGDHDGPFSLYPNGAIAVYDVEWTCHLFSDFLGAYKSVIERGLDADFDEFVRLSVRHIAFDFCLGIRSYALYGGNVFSLGAPLASVSSGCRDKHIPLVRRIEMWRSADKAAVHHIKASELPF